MWLKNIGPVVEYYSAAELQAVQIRLCRSPIWNWQRHSPFRPILFPLTSALAWHGTLGVCWAANRSANPQAQCFCCDCCGSSWVLASLRLIGRYFNRSDQFMADFAPHNHVLWLSLWFFRMSLNCLSCPESSYLRSWNQRMFSGISCVCQHGNTRSFNHFVGLW